MTAIADLISRSDRIRLHGTLIASEYVSGGYGNTDVYAGQDGKIYVHTFDGQLHRDVEPEDLSDHVGESTYIQAMRALGEEVIIDVGLPE